MDRCPHDHTKFCCVEGSACSTCPFNPNAYLDDDYDSETDDALRVDYDETDPW